MLEQVDLGLQLSKARYKALHPRLLLQLSSAEREARAAGLAVLVVFEGWDASGKGTMINRVIQALDPRAYVVLHSAEPNEMEARHPYLWRFWTRTPARGRIYFYSGSWYRRVLHDRVAKEVSRKVWMRAYEDVNAFERQLTDDGAVVVKLFLHIGKKEQKKRLKKLAANPASSWRVTKEDWKSHERYDAFAQAVEEMLARTDSAAAPWTVIEAEDQRHAEVRILGTLIAALRKGITDRAAAEAAASAKARTRKSARGKKSPPGEAAAAEIEKGSILAKADLSLSLTRKKYGPLLKRHQSRLHDLVLEIYRKKIPVVVCYEGWDAAGKGGNIRRLTQTLDPRGYEVIPIAAPNDEERAHHYLWRFWRRMPRSGHLAIFDRTWYGRVLVERVEGFCPEDVWRRAYREINEMEDELTSFGTILVKFWLHIDQEEQLRRFRARQRTSYKRWKITDEDWRNREKWPLYEAAVEEMLQRTSTAYAPWTVVESNDKLYARVKALRTVADAIESRL